MPVTEQFEPVEILSRPDDFEPVEILSIPDSIPVQRPSDPASAGAATPDMDSWFSAFNAVREKDRAANPPLEPDQTQFRITGVITPPQPGESDADYWARRRREAGVEKIIQDPAVPPYTKNRLFYGDEKAAEYNPEGGPLRRVPTFGGRFLYSAAPAIADTLAVPINIASAISEKLGGPEFGAPPGGMSGQIQAITERPTKPAERMGVVAGNIAGVLASFSPMGGFNVVGALTQKLGGLIKGSGAVSQFLIKPAAELAAFTGMSEAANTIRTGDVGGAASRAASSFPKMIEEIVHAFPAAGREIKKAVKNGGLTADDVATMAEQTSPLLTLGAIILAGRLSSGIKWSKERLLTPEGAREFAAEHPAEAKAIAASEAPPRSILDDKKPGDKVGGIDQPLSKADRAQLGAILREQEAAPPETPSDVNAAAKSGGNVILPEPGQDVSGIPIAPEKMPGKNTPIIPTSSQTNAQYEVARRNNSTDFSAATPAAEQARPPTSETPNEVQGQKEGQGQGLQVSPPEPTGGAAGPDASPKEAATPGPATIGLQKSEAEKILNIIDPTKSFPKPRRQKIEESLYAAKSSKLDEKAMELATELIGAPRPLRDIEQSALLLKAGELMNERNLSERTQGELIAANKPESAAIERTRQGEIDKKLEFLLAANDKAGTEWSHAGNVRKMIMNLLDYTYAGVAASVAKARGRSLTPVESKRVETLTDALKKAEQHVQELEKLDAAQVAEIQRLQAEREIKAVKRRRANSQKITDQLEANKQALIKAGLKINSVAGLDPEGLYLLGQRALLYVKKGVNNLHDVVQVMKSEIPDLTENDVYAAIAAKNPKADAKAKTDTQKTLKELKTQAVLLDKIIKITDGIDDPVKAKKTPSQIVAQLRKVLTVARAQAYASVTNARKLEKAVDTINHLQDQLASAQIIIKESKDKSVVPQELLDAKNKIADLRKQLNTNAEIADLEDQLATGAFRSKVRPPKRPAMSPKLERAIITRDRLRKEVNRTVSELTPMTTGQKFAFAGNELRAIKATADMSATLRQGLVLGLRHPMLATSAFAKSVDAFFRQNTAEQVDLAIRRQPEFYLFEASGGELSDLGPSRGGPMRVSGREEMFRSQLAQRIPVWGSIMRASERHMTTYLNLMRWGTFKKFLEAFPNATRAEMKGIANYINVASGRGDLGKFSAAADSMGLLLFAPRFAASRVQTPYMAWKYRDLPRVRKAVISDMVKLVAFGNAAMALAYYSGVADDATWDWHSSEFGKIRVGETHYDVWAGFAQPARLVTRALAATTDTLGITGKELLKQERDYDLFDSTARFLGYKLAPGVTVPMELITGKDIAGQPTTKKGDNESNLSYQSRRAGLVALKAITPILVQDIMDAAKQEQSAIGPARVVPFTFFGMGASTYPPTENAMRERVRRLRRAGKEAEAKDMADKWNEANPDSKDRIDSVYISPAEQEAAQAPKGPPRPPRPPRR